MELPKFGKKLIKKIKSIHGVALGIVPYNNAGETHKLEEEIEEDELGVMVEFTATGTPQQNAPVQRAFATLYGRVRAMFNGSGLDGNIED